MSQRMLSLLMRGRMAPSFTRACADHAVCPARFITSAALTNATDELQAKLRVIHEAYQRTSSYLTAHVYDCRCAASIRCIRAI